MQELIGQQLGDYFLEAELGRGSMGAVYRAQHVSDGKPYAVKVLLDALTSDQSFITRFTREARIIAGLHHPNIVRVYEAGRQGQHLYFVMEYFPGMTAGRILKERGRLPYGQVIEIIAQAADALDYAHAQGHLVHRDIKPENLMVDRWRRVKVLDFGLARVEGLHSITRAGTVVGSLYYVSPEQLLGQKLDGRTDIYALGVSMYEMLTGERPYRGGSLTEMSRAIISGIAVPPTQLEPSIPPELERIIGRAMARDLDNRYARAADLTADLRALQAASPTSDTQSQTQHPPTHADHQGAALLGRLPSVDAVPAQGGHIPPSAAPQPRPARALLRPTPFDSTDNRQGQRPHAPRPSE